MNKRKFTECEFCRIKGNHGKHWKYWVCANCRLNVRTLMFERRKLKQRAYDKENKKILKQMNICTLCWINPVMPGTITCAKCRLRAYFYRCMRRNKTPSAVGGHQNG